MNEINLSTQLVAGRKPRLAVRMNTQALGVDWAPQDILRVMSYKDDGSIIIKRVGKKISKTVCHTLTKTGGGNFSHDLGLFVSHTAKRFKKEFKSVNGIMAGARFVDEKKTMLQVYIPHEIFV